MTVNVASAKLLPSLAVILWLPTVAVVGIVIDLVNAPAEFVGVSTTSVDSKRMAITVFFANPDPVTVTVEPGGPLVGDNVMLGTALATSIKPMLDNPMQSKRNRVNGNNFRLLTFSPKLSEDVIYISACRDA